jgi:flavoprotein
MKNRFLFGLFGRSPKPGELWVNRDYEYMIVEILTSTVAKVQYVYADALDPTTVRSHGAITFKTIYKPHKG